MSFFTGFATGLASSIDDALKRDMKRTQDRIDGMGQYRVTRRRAEIERKQKDEDELREVLLSLAAFTDGDEDKAIQLYNSAGKTLAGGRDLASELRANQKAGKDVTAAITFAEAAAEPGNFTDFISRNVTPIKTLPLMEDEMEASGLYKMFKPDVGKQLMQQVEEEAPLPKAPELTTKEARDAAAKIDRTGFLEAEKAAEDIKQRERTEKEFGLKISGMELAQQRTQQTMDLAEKAEQRAARLESENADQRDIDNALKFASERRAEANLALAQEAAYRDAKAFITSQELAGLTIEDRQLELEKKRNAPQFSTYEAMLVASEQKIAALEAIPDTQKTADDKLDLQTQQSIRDTALAGINKVAQAESTPTYTATFSKQSIDSVINAEIKRQLTPVGLYDSINDKVKTIQSGNKMEYLTRMERVFDAIESRYAGVTDATLENTLQAQRNLLKEETADYKMSLINDEKVEKKQVTRDQLKDTEFMNSLKPGAVLQYKSGDVTITTIWTGSRYI